MRLGLPGATAVRGEKAGGRVSYLKAAEQRISKKTRWWLMSEAEAETEFGMKTTWLRWLMGGTGLAARAKAWWAAHRRDREWVERCWAAGVGKERRWAKEK